MIVLKSFSILMQFMKYAQKDDLSKLVQSPYCEVLAYLYRNDGMFKRCNRIAKGVGRENVHGELIYLMNRGMLECDPQRHSDRLLYRLSGTGRNFAWSFSASRKNCMC